MIEEIDPGRIRSVDEILTSNHEAAVIAGHKNPANDDNPQHIGATQKYIRDFNRLNHQTTTVLELYDKMMTRYPDRVNPGSLWSSTLAVKGGGPYE